MKMAPNQSFSLSAVPLEPVSRTYQYRKVMKPLLERKRRARINRCLDELKELMTGAFQGEGENVAKLEKADILELTVRHLHNLRDKNSLYIQQNHCQNQEQLNTEKFWDGFRQCASEVSEFLSKFDTKITVDLLSHINGYTRNLENMQPSTSVAIAANNNYKQSTSKSLTLTKSTTTQPAALMKHSRISSSSSTSTPSQRSFNFQPHQNYLASYSEMFSLNSYYYQNKNPYVKDFKYKFDKSPQYCQEKNMIGGMASLVWRPW